MKLVEASTLTSNFEVTVASLFDVKLTATVGYTDGGLCACTTQNPTTHHRTAVDACDLAFDEVLRDETRIPKQVQESLARIDKALS